MQHQKPLHRFTRNFLAGMILLYFITMFLVLILTDTITENLFTYHLKSQVKSLVKELPDNGNQQQLIHYLSQEKYRLFFRVTLLSKKRKVLYESQSQTEEAHNPLYLVNHEKILQAQQQGSSYDEHFSSVTLKDMAYIAIRFNYSGQEYILRSSFPLDPIKNLKHQLRLTFLMINSFAFFLFSSLIWLLIYRLNQPLTEILAVISSKNAHIAQGGLHEVPNFEITNANPDFAQLVMTLNSLSENVNRAFRSLMRERNEKDAILNSMVEGVLSIDQNLTIRYINPAAEEILSVNREEILDKSLSTKNLPELYKIMTKHPHIEHVVYEEITYEKSLRTRYLNILINAGAKEGESTLVIRDQTPEYELNEMRKAFVANASHELRTPITIIRGFAETLHDHPELSENMLVEITGKIVSNCERMVNLITSLMMLSRVENFHEEQFSPVDIQYLCLDTINQLRAVHPEAKIQIDLPSEELGTIRANEELLRIAIKNLVENGIKYSEKPAQVFMQFELRPADIIIKISDRGIGIPPEDLPYIFERFYRVDKARSKKTGGYGLGLSLVKTIIDKHHGSISVSSELQVGTSFTLRLRK